MADFRDKHDHHHFRFVDEEPEVQRHPRASGVQASTHLLTQPLCHLVEGNGYEAVPGGVFVASGTGSQGCFGDRSLHFQKNLL